MSSNVKMADLRLHPDAKSITCPKWAYLVRNAAGQGSNPPLLHQLFQEFTASLTAGCFSFVGDLPARLDRKI
jgi:hypothetical protein